MQMSPAVFQDDTLDESTKLLAVAGELDLSTAPELRRRVDSALHEGHARVVIDLTEVKHLDSSGLAELIGAHQRAQELRGRLAIVVTSPMIRRTLEIRGLDGLFMVADSRSDALTAIRGELDAI
jgi:anti-sigma B factor antagonist